ncbi:MAG: hypothetical protein WBV85_01620 [Solirubrobacteraceae bacterium]
MQAREIADQQYTIEHYLGRSNRKTLPLDRRFVQRRDDNNRPGPGPLGEFVRRSRETALDQYLWLHAVASSNNDGRFDVRLPATTWARAVGGYFDPKTGVVEPAALHAVSRNWRLLQQFGLIDRQRVGRRVRVWLLADDGSGDPYEHPGEGTEGKTLDGGPGYVQLPYAYWYDRWHERLSLAAKAVLLIAMAAGDGFALPYTKFQDWYGVSASTGERGLTELRERNLLHREQHRRPDTESPVGFSDVYHYELLPPFGPRNALSKSAPPFWSGPPKAKVSGKRRRASRSAKASKKAATPGRTRSRRSE